jgi:uncharacterized protein YifN (PemK superfamily)
MYYPRNAEVVQCDFSGFKAPEMVKTRPVIVIGPRLRHRGDLATIVPLSTSPKTNPEAWQVKVTLIQKLPAPFDITEAWAICDMVCSISTDRLDRFKPHRPRYGARGKWVTSSISKDDLQLVRQGVASSLGFGTLTF